jgi:tryptophan synthase alpha chain
MTKISEIFAQLKEKDEGALIAYITVGDPHPKKTTRLVGALIEGGTDIIELGIPFSDPIADGPTIQSAVSRSLASGAKPLDALETARTVHERYDTPLVLMTYFNPIYRVGLSKFLGLAKESGISGVIVPDLPVEESADYKKECVAAGIDTIFLASPSTNPERLKQILTQTSGYLYLISLYGVTGVRAAVAESALNLISQYSELIAGSVPLAVGFGISKPEHVRQIFQAGADGAIVGSAFVNIIGKNSRNVPRAAKKLENLARAMKKASRTAS